MPGRAGGLLRWLLVERVLHPPPDDPDPSSFAVATPAVAAPRAEPDALVVTWIGHSTFLIQLGCVNILTDPMWGERASPTRFAGPRRWVRPGIALADLPPIDAVVQSHNHYDHLDDTTVRSLARSHPRARGFAPLGLAPFLRTRGVRELAELDWWEERDADGLLKRYLVKNPKDANARVDLGICYFETDKLDEAQTEMKTALKYDPKHIQAHFNLGIVTLKARKFQESNEWFRKTIEIAPPNSEMGQQAKQFLEQHSSPLIQNK